MGYLSDEFIDSLPDLICRCKPDTTLIYVNRAYAQLHGMSKQDLIGKRFLDILSDADSRFVAENLARLTPENPRVTYYLSYLSPTMREITLHWYEQANFDDDGNLIEIHSVGRDITQLKQYQSSLETLLDLGRDTSHTFDQRLDELLEAGRRFFGLPHGFIGRLQGGKWIVEHASSAQTPDEAAITQLIGDTGFHMSQADYSVIAFDRLSQSAVPDDVRNRFRLEFESYIGAPIYVNGEFHGAVSFGGMEPRADPFRPDETTFMRLIARWAGFEIERNNTLCSLDLQNRELRFIFDSLPALVWFKDDKNNHLRMNKKAAESLGMSVEDAEGGSAFDQLPEIADRIFADDKEVLRGNKPKRGIIEHVALKSGDRRWLSTDKIPYMDETTGDRRLLIVSSDITDLLQQQKDLQTVNAHLKRANEDLQKFAYVASHDLQEPMRKIRSFAEILQEAVRDDDPSERDYAVDVITDSAARGSQLIRGLLAYSRVANRPLKLEQSDLRSIITKTVDTLGQQERAAGAEIRLELQPLTLLADADQIRLLITNLVANAVQYRHAERDPVVTVTIKDDPATKGVILSVADNGIGFSAEYANQIFEPFKRLHRHADSPGSGIGLAVCARVAERHGWTLTAKSNYGHGAEFEVMIPSDAIIVDRQVKTG